MSDAVDEPFERDGLRLRALRFGDGAAERGLLVLPGITSPAAVWGFVAAPLQDRIAVHVLDLRGRGRSGAPADGDYSLGAYAADAAAAIRGLGLSGQPVVGHSLGARIAARLAVDEPGLAGPLILVDPPLSGPGRAPYPYPVGFYLDAIAAARRGELTAEQVRRDHPAWSDEQVAGRVEWLPSCDPTAVAETHRHFHDEDFHELWRALDAPVLISGGTSPVVDDAGRAELLELNPSATSIVVEGAGHMIPWDRPAPFVTALEGALRARGVKL